MANTRFVRVQLIVDSGTDQVRTQKNFYRDQYSDSQMVNDDIQSGTVAVNSTVAVNMDQLTQVSLIYIESSGPLQVQVNGQAPPGWTMQALPNAIDQGQVSPALARCAIEGVFTLLSLTNPSGAPSAVDYTVYLVGT